MLHARISSSVLLAAACLLLLPDAHAQQRPPERGPEFDASPGARDGRRDGLPPPPPPRDGQGDRPPFGAPGDRPPGPPHDRPPHDGPPHDGPPRDGRPPHGRFGQQHELQRMEELKELDPELYEFEKSDRELDRKTFELSEQLRRAPENKRKELVELLAKVVSEHFDVRQARRELHLKRLAEELDKLRDSIKRRTEVRDNIISKRVNELIGKEDDLAF